ncbi:MAG: YigZ family protein [Chloroflexota bacterium]|nr:YigZ family protein [Chloroflexota bacterium]
MEPNLVPAQEKRNEIMAGNSRFIATLAPAFSVTEARAFIGRIKEEFADATHNVPAFVIGHGAAVTAHCNDDGEPSGTAGRPALAVLQGSGWGDLVVVVTRYFGGAKLGTGGLVRAYGAAVREVLAITPVAQKVTTHTVLLATDYHYFEQVRLLVPAHHGQILDEEFAGDVLVTARFPVAQFPAFQNSLRNLSGGQLEALIITTEEDTLLPLPA